MHLKNFLTWAKQNRPELRQTQIEREVDQLSVNLAMAERYPTFLFGGAYEVRDRTFPIQESNWNATLTMNIPLFNGFASLARIKESKHKAKRGKFRRVSLEDQIEREVRLAFEDMNYWINELDTRRRELGFLQNSRDQYEKSGSKKGSREHLDYLGWSLDARLSVIEAREKIAVAVSHLQKVIGRSVGGVRP